MTLSPEAFANDVPCTWCPGCGNLALRQAVVAALVELDLPPHRVAIVSGIGQAAKMPHYVRCNGFNGLHGRAVPVATAVRLAAPDLPTIVHAGDGDCYGEGLGHLVHAMRRNVNLTVIVHDNRIYGLTKGQSSPTTALGQTTSSERHGARTAPLDPLALALSQNCSFVAQGFTGAPDGLTKLVVEGVRHRGFSLINVLQPCVSFNKLHTFAWFKQHSFDLALDWDDGNRAAALDLLLQADEKLPLGILYRQKRPTFETLLRGDDAPPLRDASVSPERVLPLLERFR